MHSFPPLAYQILHCTYVVCGEFFCLNWNFWNSKRWKESSRRLFPHERRPILSASIMMKKYVDLWHWQRLPGPGITPPQTSGQVGAGDCRTRTHGTPPPSTVPGTMTWPNSRDGPASENVFPRMRTARASGRSVSVMGPVGSAASNQVRHSI
jgi:hypothetical protein